MSSSIRLGGLVALLALSCAGEATPPPVASPASPPTANAPAAPVASVAADAPGTANAPVEPSALTADQKKRDAALAPRAAAVVDAFPNWNGFFSSLVARWSPDGKHVLFGSTRDGLPQIYLADPGRPKDPPKALTSGTDRALDARFTRDGKSVLFLRDEKGNELHAIWRVGVDGTGLVNVTPGEPLRRGLPFLPPKKPRTMFYSAGRVSETSYRVLEQSLDGDGGEAKVVYTSRESGDLVGVTNDGARALVTDFHSAGDVVTWELDVATGRTHRIYPPEGKSAALHSIAYDADGKRVLLTTDEGAESSVLLALDPASGKELARYVSDAPKGAPLNATPSPAGDRIALGVDAGSHGELRILDARTLKLQRAVKVPLGDVLVGDFRDDGRALSLVVSLPNQPADVFEVNPATGDVKPLRADARAGVDGLGEIDTTIEAVPAFDGLTIPVNRYLPALEPGKRAPTLVIFHGGPMTSYAVRWNPYARFFVSLGYAVLEPNVRGSSGFGRAYEKADDREKRADWLKDLETVNAWAKGQPWCDPERVIVWGQSYGGYTTLMALTRQPALWRAGVDLYGPADLKKFLRSTDASIRKAFVTEFGDIDADAALLEQFSPMRDVDKITRPLFVYQGQNDPRVPRTEGDAVVQALRARGVPVEYMVAPNEGHAVDHRENKIELLTRTARFLEDNAKKNP